MCRFEALGVSWPPRGWKQLRHIEKTSGQAITKDPASAQVTGLVYNIEPAPIYRDSNTRLIAYDIQIDGWEYTIHNESREYRFYLLYYRIALMHLLRRIYIFQILKQNRDWCM